MDSIFKSLERTAQSLNSAADQANERIRDVNERLLDIGVGTEFWWNRKPFEVTPTVGGEWTQSVLGYARVKGTWQLGALIERWGHSDEFDEDAIAECSLVALLSASRELRILMAAEIPEFLEAYDSRLQEIAAKISRPQTLPKIARKNWAPITLGILPGTTSGSVKKALDDLNESVGGGLFLPTPIPNDPTDTMVPYVIKIDPERRQELFQRIRETAIANGFDVVAK